jgi:integrase
MLPLDPALVTRLQRHRRRQLAERLNLGERWVDDRLIFASEIGSALDLHNVRRRFRARCRRAKVPPRRLYDLRHSVGTAMIASGVDARTVSEVLGHRSVLTTLMHYTHPDAAQHRRAIGALPWAKADASASVG